MTYEEAFNELIHYFLGDKYYIADPVNGDQARDIMVEDIKRLYSRGKEKTPKFSLTWSFKNKKIAEPEIVIGEAALTKLIMKDGVMNG